MGIYDRDWWRERYNKRNAWNEHRDANWRQPTTPHQPPVGKPTTPPRPTGYQLKPSPVAAILIWLFIFAVILTVAKALLAHKI